ncbi:MAG: BamA/TamA family outer membrane protein [Variovorax sp.]
MLRVAPSITPAWLPAFLLVSALVLQGCSLLPNRASSGDQGGTPVESSSAEKKRDAFSVRLDAPDTVRDYLARNLELQRYRQIDDLGAVELSRLMVAAEANARELLNTLGYFTPTITLELRETPEAAAPREVLITVAPGEVTRIRQVDIGFSGPMADDPTAEAQRNAVRAAWTLPAGQAFTQQAWDNAKSSGLRTLTARRYATASVLGSQADIDADDASAKLQVRYASGPAYRFGALQVRGTERYSADDARRLARLPTGTEYDQQKLLDTQQRLASSGYYDSVFLTLDTTSETPLAAPVIAQVREAPLQKIVAGVGFTTDNGLRVSADHSHNQIPWLEWRAVSKLLIDKNTASLGTEWTAIPDDRGWRWFSGADIKRDTSGDYPINSARVRSGRSKASDHIDRSYFLQYDNAHNQGLGAPPSASALTLNWSWTGRYFDSPTTPARGQGLAIEVGAGYTLTGERLPFARTYARWLGFVPLGTVTPDDSTQARRARLALRAQAGAVVADDKAQIPTTLLFLTGGDTTVRGYSFQEIGVTNALGQTVGGRYLGVASIEWQRPIVWDGKMTNFESAVFVDAGGVADKPAQLDAKVGTGFGVRWKSPVGPVQADIAYGVAVKKFRLHLRLGFTF